MRAIWKYPLEITDHQVLALPQPAQVLSVQFQGGQLCLWALVSPDHEITPENGTVVHIVGTGHPVEDEARLTFIDTVQMGPLVWHIFTQEA